MSENKININSYKPFLIGIFLILIIGAGIFGLNYINEDVIQSSEMNFIIQFDDAQGIVIGNSVNMLGKKIGRVEKVELIDRKARISISADQYDIPIDSRFEIIQENLIGEKIIRILPGNANKVSIKEGDLIVGKDPVPSSITGDISFLLKKLNNLFTQELSDDVVVGIDKIKSSSEMINSIIDENRDNITISIDNIAESTDALNNFINENKNIISQEDRDKLKEVIENLNIASKDIKQVVNNKSDDIESTIDNIKIFTDNLPVITGKFTDLSNQLELVLLNLNEGDGTLSKIIRDDELYNNTNNLVVETTNLISEVKAEIDGIANNANSVVNNLNSVIDKINNIVEEFNTDKGFKKYVKLYLKAEKEFKKEEKNKK